MKSKITSKFQITIPGEVRERLRLHVADAIEWKLEGERIYVEAAEKPFLKHRGVIEVGEGDIKQDIEQSRAARGHKYQ